MQDAYPGVSYSMGTKAKRRKADVHYAAHFLISRGNLQKSYA